MKVAADGTDRSPANQAQTCLFALLISSTNNSMQSCGQQLRRLRCPKLSTMSTKQISASKYQFQLLSTTIICTKFNHDVYFYLPELLCFILPVSDMSPSGGLF